MLGFPTHTAAAAIMHNSAGVFQVLLRMLPSFTDLTVLNLTLKIEREMVFSNFSCMFLNPNNFFQFES